MTYLNISEAEIAIEFQKMKNSYPKYNQYYKKPKVLMEAEKVLHGKLREVREEQKCQLISK